jgi:hypothetical protein
MAISAIIFKNTDKLRHPLIVESSRCLLLQLHKRRQNFLGDFINKKYNEKVDVYGLPTSTFDYLSSGILALVGSNAQTLKRLDIYILFSIAIQILYRQMVYSGKPSKACEECRSRRTKVNIIERLCIYQLHD